MHNPVIIQMNEHINLDKIFTWRNNNQLVTKLQDYGVIHKDNKIKCPIKDCDGYFKIHIDENRADGARLIFSGIIRCPKKKSVKCFKKLEM